MQCLPRAPVTEEEKRIETEKVFGYYRAEKEAEEKAKAKYLLALQDYETQTGSSASQRGNSETMEFERQLQKPKRDLKDFDSYDVLGKRVDPDGTTRHFIEWKTPGLEDESEDSDSGVRVEQTDDKNPIFTKAEK